MTTIHLAFQTIATRVLRKYTTMVDKAKELEATGASGREAHARLRRACRRLTRFVPAGVMNRDAFLRKIVPVGLLFSASLVLSNWVYLRLTVSFSKLAGGVTLSLPVKSHCPSFRSADPGLSPLQSK